MSPRQTSATAGKGRPEAASNQAADTTTRRPHTKNTKKNGQSNYIKSCYKNNAICMFFGPASQGPCLELRISGGTLGCWPNWDQTSIKPGANQGQNQGQTRVKPRSNQVRSSVEPVPSMANQDPTRVKPGPKPMSNQNKIKAKPLSNNCKPESNHDQAMASQGRSRVEAVSNQTRSSQCQTRVKPGPNKNQTFVKPGSDRVKAWTNHGQSMPRPKSGSNHGQAKVKSPKQGRAGDNVTLAPVHHTPGQTQNS